MHFLHRSLLFLVSSSIFYYVLNFIEPPTSWNESSTYQVLIFFLPLLLSIVFLINLFLNQILRSFVVGLGIMFTLALMAGKMLTPITSAITFFLTGIIFVYTPAIHLRILQSKPIKRIGHHDPDHKPEKHPKPPRIIKRL